MSAAAEPAAPASAARRLHLSFARDGDAAQYLSAGWSKPEGDYSWSIGAESTLAIPSPGFSGRAILSLTGWPHLQPERITRQRILITVNGIELGRLTMDRRGTLSRAIPRRALAGHGTIAITLRHPDAARPADFPGGNARDSRVLGVAYHALTIEEMDHDQASLSARIRTVIKAPIADRRLICAPPLPAAEARAAAAPILQHFQSLGDDCEFGIVQRETGIEPLGLFRFSKIPLEHVIRGLQAGFARMAADGDLEIVEYTDVPGHDYMGRERNYGMLYHTGRMPGEIDPAILKTQETQRLRFMARKIMEDAALPDQIFVVKRKQRPLISAIARLVLALEECGPSRLLWICEAAGDVPPGTAERVTDHLVVAYVDRIDVAPLQAVSIDSWVAACRAAWLVFQQQ